MSRPPTLPDWQIPTGESSRASNPQKRGNPTDLDLLTPDELKAKLKISTRSYSNLMRAGLLPFRLVGKMKRFVWAEVVAAFPKSTDTNPTKGGGRPTLDLVGQLKRDAARWGR